MGTRTDSVKVHTVKVALTTPSGVRVHERTIQLRDRSRSNAVHRVVTALKASGHTAVTVLP